MDSASEVAGGEEGVTSLDIALDFPTAGTFFYVCARHCDPVKDWCHCRAFAHKLRVRVLPNLNISGTVAAIPIAPDASTASPSTGASADDTAAPTTPSPTPAGSTQQLTASLAIAVSAEALSAMMASPDSAVAGLEEGFSDFIGVDKEYVSVQSSDPKLHSGRRLVDFLSSFYMFAGRRLQSSLTVDYAVNLPADVLAATPDLFASVESQLTAANDDPAALATLGSNLETFLAAAGIDVAVTVSGVAAEVPS